jgi:hypothetical protein
MTAGLPRRAASRARPGFRRQWAAPGIEQLSARWRQQRGQREWRIRSAHPVDAVSEFRILTLNAPAEYGNTSGATTSVVTKSGSNAFTATSTTSSATTPSTRATSSPPPPSRCTAISTAPRSADPSARTRISSSSTTKGSAIPRADPGRHRTHRRRADRRFLRAHRPLHRTAARSSTSSPASRFPATRFRVPAEPDRAELRRNCTRSPISAPTCTNPPRSDRTTTTRAASASITTSAAASDQLFAALLHVVACTSSIRCPSPAPACPVFRSPTTSSTNSVTVS